MRKKLDTDSEPCKEMRITLEGQTTVIRHKTRQKKGKSGQYLMQLLIALFMSTAMNFGFSTGFARAETLEAHYKISLAGFSIGHAILSGTVQSDSYSLTVSARLTGLVGAITSGHGGASARGNLSNQPLSNGFSLTASNGSFTRTVQISAVAGAVKAVKIEPPFEEKDDRVPVKPNHLIGVVDPVSALLLPVLGNNAFDKANCNRKIPVFDGTQRFDVTLSFVEKREIEHESGYKGSVLVCAARYVPQAGHRPARKVTKFMSENKQMEAWLVPVGGSDALVPLRISVKTMIGTSLIEMAGYSGLKGVPPSRNGTKP